MPAEMSRLVYSTFVPSMDRTEIRSSPSRVTSASLPSGEIAAWLVPDFSSATVTLPAGVPRFPLVVLNRQGAPARVGPRARGAPGVVREAARALAGSGGGGRWRGGPLLTT